MHFFDDSLFNLFMLNLCLCILKCSLIWSPTIECLMELNEKIYLMFSPVFVHSSLPLNYLISYWALQDQGIKDQADEKYQCFTVWFSLWVQRCQVQWHQIHYCFQVRFASEQYSLNCSQLLLVTLFFNW